MYMSAYLCTVPYLGQTGFLTFKDPFLEATFIHMAETSRISRFSFWNGQIHSSIQIEKIMKWVSDLNCHEESPQDEEFVHVAKTQLVQ